MAHKQIIRDIHAGKFSPLYVLHGEESFFIEEISKAIISSVVDEASKDFNETILYGRDTDIADILAASRRFPMMSDRQLVLVKEAQELKCWKRKDELEKLAAYAESPLSSTVLVFCYMNKKIDGRSKAVKALSKNGILFLSDKLLDYKLPQWIAEYISSVKLSIDPQSAQLLAEYLGNDLRKVVNEITKLKISLPEGSALTSEVIEKHIGISKDYNVFELQRALGTKDVEKSSRIVNHFEANPKNNPLAMVIPVLSAYFSRLFVYHGLKDKSQNAAARAMSCSPYAVRDYSSAAKVYSVSKVARIFGYLRDADRKSKGQGNATISDGMLLRETVFKILN
ncbi:MAG: DNA polymerase III subunit delta [Bacteroidetes bacterium]|jgi:DNA polymerase III subunit delta|nr:DNA polymerase III subunit delta [Bacteroidota bacterium]MDA0980693.1 DNA polymerase III subunit delta [Bacteroidota bacterium]